MPFQPCPKCKKTVLTRFNYCPFCGADLSAQFRADELSQLFGVLDTSAGHTHDLAKERLCEMGKNLGYTVVPEYTAYDMPGMASKRDIIDVVWLSGDKIVAAFEVRGRRRGLNMYFGYKDRDELASLQASEKFIVNVSIITGKAYFHRLRKDLSIEYAPVAGEEVSKLDDLRKTYPKAFEKWTPDEDQVLTEQYKKGIQIELLADLHNRTPWAIQRRLEKLGLLQPRNSHG